MDTINIKLYNILKNDIKLPDAKAQEFIHALDELVQADIKNSATEYKSVIKDDLNKLDIKIEQTKSDIIKWLFTFWVGTIGIAILFYFLKK